MHKPAVVGSPTGLRVFPVRSDAGTEEFQLSHLESLLELHKRQRKHWLSLSLLVSLGRLLDHAGA